jgi:sporulation protein YlmC with PRC-barrel domain
MSRHWRAKLWEECIVKKFLTAAALVALATPALAQPMMSTPPTGKTINDYYKQSVYNPSATKIGSVDDILTSDQGQITALIIGVGGVAGMGERDVAVPFSAVQAKMKDDKWYLTLNATEDQLKSAPALTFDKTKSAWVPSK